MKNYFIYIIECSNGSFYTGYTTDLDRRFREHLKGTAACKYTRSFPPKKLVASWSIHNNLSIVLRLERAIKGLTKSQKLQLINTPELFQILKNNILAEAN
ncbi:MAG: GIY-YIG nuclease family protein [Legionellales bacterium]|nr:GIY-YIG nuclease family protein [Legionellales bacterium]